MAARSKAWVCGRSLAGDCEFESCLGYECLPPESVVFCQVEVSAIGRSLVYRSPTECGVSEYDRGTSTIRRPRPTRGCRARGGGISSLSHGCYMVC